MKKIIFLFISLISIQANSQWVQIATVPTTQLNAVKFFDVNTGIAVGANGIWRSTTSGVNWVQVLSSSNLNSVSFPDNNNGYAVGDSGKIFRTFDNGQTWSQQISGTTNNLYSVSFYNSTVGQIVGQNGIILRTQTGGSNWYTNVNQLTEDLNCVQMINDSQTAIAVGSVSRELFLSTANGGTNWIYTLNINGNNLKSVSKITGSTVEVCGTNGIVRRSTNYGGTWNTISSGTSQQLNCIAFPDNNTGYICGNQGVILQSTNSGSNWTVMSSPVNNNIKSASFINANIGWLVGQGGVVLRIGIISAVSNNENIPESFSLGNFPNPFNPTSRIHFSIPESGLVSLTVYNLKGDVIEELLHKQLSQGSYEVTFNGSTYASGVYLYRLNIKGKNSRNLTKKLVLIK